MRNRWFTLALCYRGLVFLQAQRAEDWCSQSERLQTKLSNEATDGLTLSMSDCFWGAVRAAFHVVPPAIVETSGQETAASSSHHAPEACCSREETLQAQRPEEWCSQKEPLQTHMSIEATDGLSPSVFAICFGRSYSVFPCFSANKRSKPEARNQGFGLASCSPSLDFPDGSIAGPKSNTACDPSLETSNRPIGVFLAAPIAS